MVFWFDLIFFSSDNDEDESFPNIDGAIVKVECEVDCLSFIDIKKEDDSSSLPFTDVHLKEEDDFNSTPFIDIDVKKEKEDVYSFPEFVSSNFSFIYNNKYRIFSIFMF